MQSKGEEANSTIRHLVIFETAVYLSIVTNHEQLRRILLHWF